VRVSLHLFPSFRKYLRRVYPGDFFYRSILPIDPVEDILKWSSFGSASICTALSVNQLVKASESSFLMLASWTCGLTIGASVAFASYLESHTWLLLGTPKRISYAKLGSLLLPSSLGGLWLYVGPKAVSAAYELWSVSTPSSISSFLVSAYWLGFVVLFLCMFLQKIVGSRYLRGEVTSELVATRKLKYLLQVCAALFLLAVCLVASGPARLANWLILPLIISYPIWIATNFLIWSQAEINRDCDIERTLVYSLSGFGLVALPLSTVSWFVRCLLWTLCLCGIY